jgi:hypothetical protein
MHFFTTFTALLVMIAPIVVIAHPIEGNEQLSQREIDDSLNQLFARAGGM